VKSVLALVALCCATAYPLAQTPADPVPQTVEEFRDAAARVLTEAGVPGAGVALVRHDGVEWAGGIGYADRERRTPVTADTGFRVGSISKTFVAIALVQLAEDGFLDLDAPVFDIAPDIVIDNPWEDTHPVRVIHLLQHTAGFDDMHFNETYVRGTRPELSLEDVLRLNPSSRRVRWQPGTRMAYSNPGYGVAGLILERTAAMPYEDYIEQEIFQPLGMASSSFRLTTDDEARLARGYSAIDGPPVEFSRIYLRPAGNMVSSAHDMGRFVQMLLGWGELDDAGGQSRAAKRVRQRHFHTSRPAVQDARPHRRHRRFPLELRLLPLARCRLRRAAEQRGTSCGRSDATVVEDGRQLSEAGCGRA